MGNGCSSFGVGPPDSSPLHGRRLSAHDNEERKFPPSSDADAQLAIVLQNRAINEARGAKADCLGESTWQPQSGPLAPARSQLLLRVQNLGWQLLQLLPFRDLSVLATAAKGFRTLIWQHPAYLDALPVHGLLINPLTDVKLLEEADKEMSAFMRQEHALLDKLGAEMERSGWPTPAIRKLMSELSPKKFAARVEIDGLLKKADAGTINPTERRWLCFSLSSFEPAELIEEAIAEAAKGNRDLLHDLARRTAINNCVAEIHDLAKRSESLKAQEEALKLLPKHSIALLKAKYVHAKVRDSIHSLSHARRDQLVALSARLAALRDDDRRPQGLFANILNAIEQLQASHPADRIQSRQLLAKGFEHELNEHLVECDSWIQACSKQPIDLTPIDLKRVGMAWSRAGLPVSALQTMSEAIRLAHLDHGAALRAHLTVLRDGLLATATTSLMEHYAVESNPTVSFSSSPPPAPMAANEFTFTHVDRITGKVYPPERHVHNGDKPFAKRFVVTNDDGEIVHVRTHVFNARPRRSQRNQPAFSGQSEPVVMHLDESKRPWPAPSHGSDPEGETKRR
jgi:hypothetical protein